MAMKITLKEVIVLSAILFALFSSISSVAAESSDIQATLNNIDQYSKGIKLGTKYDDAARKFGKPLQKKALPKNKAAFTAIWKLDNYSVDVSVGENNQVESYGIHWFGTPDKIPDFKKIYAGKFESENRKGSDLSRQSNKDVVVCWSKKPIKGRKEIVSVLSVSKKDSKTPACQFSRELKK